MLWFDPSHSLSTVQWSQTSVVVNMGTALVVMSLAVSCVLMWSCDTLA